MPSGEIDLHDLHVDEAISFTALAIQGAKQRGDPDLRLIVGSWILEIDLSPSRPTHRLNSGKGRHSEGGVPKLKPAIQKYLRQ